MIKTLQGWGEETFEEYVKPGEEIDEALYFYFMGTVPTETHFSTVDSETFQVGEATDHKFGKPRYATFRSLVIQSETKYFFEGVMEKVKNPANRK